MSLDLLAMKQDAAGCGQLLTDIARSFHRKVLAAAEHSGRSPGSALA